MRNLPKMLFVLGMLALMVWTSPTLTAQPDPGDPPCDVVTVVEADGTVVTYLDCDGELIPIDPGFPPFPSDSTILPPGDPCDVVTVVEADGTVVTYFDCDGELIPIDPGFPPFPSDSTILPPGDPCDVVTVVEADGTVVTYLDCDGELIPIDPVFPPFPTDSFPEPSVDEFIEMLIADLPGASDCIDGQTFTTIDEVFVFIETNCPDVFGSDPVLPPDSLPIDPWTVEDELAWLIDAFEGVEDCVDGVSFATVDDIYTYIGTNCPEVFDFPPFPEDSILPPFPTDPWTVEDELEWLIACFEDVEGCVDGVTFATIDDLYAYIDANCPDALGGSWITFPDDSTFVLPGGPDFTWTVEDEIEWLEATFELDGCLDGAPAFADIEELYAYLEVNCADALGTPVVPDFEVPDCLVDVDTLSTFQAFIASAAANCPDLILGLPDCFFDAPVFATDDEFFAWLEVNCAPSAAPTGSSVAENLMRTYQLSSENQDEEATGIFSPSQNEVSISIYPNPATDNTTISLRDAQISAYQIFDLSGRSVVEEGNLNVRSLNINTSELAKGVYVIKVTTNEGAIANQKLSIH